MEKEFRKLRFYNGFMGALHLVQAILMLLISNDTSYNLTTNFLRVTVKGPEDFSAVSSEEVFLRVYLGPLIALFLLLSAIAHFLIASPSINVWYNENLKKGINKIRWVEYALSSSVMIVVIAILCGMYDAPSLLLLFTLNAMMNLFGFMMEVHNQEKKRVDWTSFIFGIIAGIVPWVVITWYFVEAVTGVEGVATVPDFVYGILVSIFLFFNVFAINMFLQYKKIGPWKNYLFGEKIYILLSLLAKSALAWQVFSGTHR